MPGCSSDKAPLNLCVELLLSPGGSSADVRGLAFVIDLPFLDRRVERKRNDCELCNWRFNERKVPDAPDGMQLSVRPMKI
jgi:hypothetical protein